MNDEEFTFVDSFFISLENRGGFMRTVRYEFLRPQEILDAQKEKSIVYLPLGPLEWHGPAMPFGTDPLAIEAAARKIAERAGGVVLPTLYAGTERERDPELLDALGFETDQYIVGQDFPKNTLPSMYMREEVFSLIVREYLRMLVKQKYKLVVILNGHGAVNQCQVLDRLATEFSNETDTKVVVMMANPIDGSMEFEGHATKAEHAVQMYLDETNVDLSLLPQKPERLKNCDWGIDGGNTYRLQPNADKTVEEECDPRDATFEIGREFFEKGVDVAVDRVIKIWEEMIR